MAAIIAALMSTVVFVGAPPAPACEIGACAVAPNIIYLADPHDLRAFRHEIGHIFDYQVMDDGARRRFRSIMGERGRPWRTAPNSPHEQFAEAFRICAQSTRFPSWPGGAMGGYGYSPSIAQHRAVCRLILSQWEKGGPPG